ncbi:ribosome-recycling factor, mitochondrial isoform X2 [Macaca thibetana thibetana]|uniref:ribosome-recycling factor, mitochondrial isoform X2 n=1 Tax=Macaca thibetana thibetana TaxID=257877 RepID=UPI000D30EA8C|nr:ribosome-recycling factor, mitochondrial isoform X2 [Macaca nemestrina]XP_050617948.1 ribosome-recycling factor, mitochondrial isoform X2 [Macaca thibetana thibetana]
MPGNQVPTPRSDGPLAASASMPPAARPPVTRYACAASSPRDVTTPAQLRSPPSHESFLSNLGDSCGCFQGSSSVMALGLKCFRMFHPAFRNYLAASIKPVSEVTLKTVHERQHGHRQYVAYSAVPVRHFATKKAKGSLDKIAVVTADGKLALNQIGQISMKSPQLILVNMASFPECTAAAIKAIRESGMNLNPEVEGTLIRVPIPQVTREHRETLVKLAKQNTNKAKDSLRKVRTNAMNKLKKSKDTVSEDTIRLVEKQISQMADDTVAELDRHLAVKTKELLG